MMDALNSGALKAGVDFEVIQVSDEQAAVLLTTSHRLLTVKRSLAERLARGGPLEGGEAEEWEEIQALERSERANASALAAARYFDGADLAINVNLTGVCNLACTYCFADGGDYGRIKSKMGLDLVDGIMGFIEARAGQTNRGVRFEFFGGEPLLNFPVIESLCRRSREYSLASGRRFSYRISTNLTHIPKGCFELFAEFGFVVSVSIDGGRATHDRNRPNKGGQGSFDGILENCRKVRALGESVTLVARMTVADAQDSLVANLRELWQHNLFDYFQVLPSVGAPKTPLLTVRRGADARPPATVGDGVATEFQELLASYDSFFTEDNRFCGLLEYERTIEMLRDGLLAASFCGAGRNYYTVSPDASIMPCHRLVGQVEFQLGSLEAKGSPETAVDLDASCSPWRKTVEQHPVCGSCWARYMCGGNCKQENFVASGNIAGVNTETCGFQLENIRGVVRHLVRTGRWQRARHRRLDDMFVSCGRPVLANGRRDMTDIGSRWQHFTQIT